MNPNATAAQIICAILVEEMDLPAANVWLRDQNRKIPNDNGLYIAVGMVDSHPITVETYLTETTVGDVVNTNEVNEVYTREVIQIDIWSSSGLALTRNWEILAALRSIYSSQQQEANFFKIPRISSQFIDTTAAEGGSTLNRYTLTFSAFVWYRKTAILSSSGGLYYDDFTTREDSEQTIGTDTPEIEFEINQGGVVP